MYLVNLEHCLTALESWFMNNHVNIVFKGAKTILTSLGVVWAYLIFGWYFSLSLSPNMKTVSGVAIILKCFLFIPQKYYCIKTNNRVYHVSFISSFLEMTCLLKCGHTVFLLIFQVGQKKNIFMSVENKLADESCQVLSGCVERLSVCNHMAAKQTQTTGGKLLRHISAIKYSHELNEGSTCAETHFLWHWFRSQLCLSGVEIKGEAMGGEWDDRGKQTYFSVHTNCHTDCQVYVWLSNSAFNEMLEKIFFFIMCSHASPVQV